MLPFKNPTIISQSSFSISTPRSVVFGNTFSILNFGGYTEVYGLEDLEVVLTGASKLMRAMADIGVVRLAAQIRTTCTSVATMTARYPN